MNLAENIKINWSILYVGLKDQFIDSKKVVELINKNTIVEGLDENVLIDINVNEEDENFILEFLNIRRQLSQEKESVLIWQFLHLLDIRESKKTIQEKLIDIEVQWSKLDYPESWREFIYYLPTEDKDKSSESVYMRYIKYCDEQFERFKGLRRAPLIIKKQTPN